jgi:hypothetical protein
MADPLHSLKARARIASPRIGRNLKNGKAQAETIILCHGLSTVRGDISGGRENHNKDGAEWAF